ncbi:MAG: metalloregulator ArsR/SmtB family transcription factor [Bacillota bacterium]|nr:metalloregulator ArsR/SmtB family transcription factor [Bacillota bacterium]
MVKINKLDENNMTSVKFCVHPPMEFLYAMYDTAKEEELYKVYEEFNFTPDEEMKNIIGEMRGQLSRYNLSELTYFFYMSETIGHILPSFIMYNPNVINVEELISIIENSDEKLILFYLVKNIINENSIEYRKGFNWNEARDDIPKMIQLVKDTDINNIDIKEKLLECLDNPIETKQRYCMMIRSFYERAFKPIEEEVLEKLQSIKQKYERAFMENPEGFFKSYFKMEVIRCQIHVSYFKYTAWFSYPAEDIDTIGWIVLGIHSDKVFGKDAIRERVNKFFWILSDKKRLNMIDLLVERPWYGHEMAQKLKLTPATVSYHMSFLLELDIVTFQRDENRLYYSLNKNKVEELFEQAKRALLHRGF